MNLHLLTPFSETIFLVLKWIFALGVAVIGYIIIRLAVFYVMRSVSKHIPSYLSGLINYILIYGLYGLLAMTILQTAGVNLSAFIAAAGVTGVALGFAAQTSLSNIISGIMLLFEQSFNEDDLIVCDGLQGRVDSIGLLSITLKTSDNQTIRIPNERLIRANVTNKSSFKNRRISFIASIDPQKQSVENAFSLLVDCASGFSYRIKSKDANIIFDASSPYAVGVTIHIWVLSKEVIAAKSAFVQESSDRILKAGYHIYISAK